MAAVIPAAIALRQKSRRSMIDPPFQHLLKAGSWHIRHL
jgi:hypothetical protein